MVPKDSQGDLWIGTGYHSIQMKCVYHHVLMALCPPRCDILRGPRRWEPGWREGERFPNLLSAVCWEVSSLCHQPPVALRVSPEQPQSPGSQGQQHRPPVNPSSVRSDTVTFKKQNKETTKTTTMISKRTSLELLSFREKQADRDSRQKAEVRKSPSVPPGTLKGPCRPVQLWGHGSCREMTGNTPLQFVPGAGTTVIIWKSASSSGRVSLE